MSEDTVRQQYNQLASVYDRRWNQYITKTLLFLKDWVTIPPDASVLDLACGTGEFERLVLQENPTQSITGVDISESMVAIARQKCQDYPHVSFHIGSASALPFPAECFDVIVSANAFHYFDDPIAALAEMQRVLKPEGEVIILDWCKDYWFCRICDLLLKLIDPAHKQCFTQAEFHHFLTLAGFEIQAATRFQIDWLWGLMVATASPA
jgi:ubiquinone/menaquinone biosynthesis C-methylase UbiE